MLAIENKEDSTERSDQLARDADRLVTPGRRRERVSCRSRVTRSPLEVGLIRYPPTTDRGAVQ